ncbi:MAG: shikimate kinase AroK, partial [Pseudomonadota bacterium]|nr:shikimate kinase AroK [Pseudomonadota bacterium]
MHSKRNIFLIGPMGSGKSAVGRQLARIFHLDFYDS